jgi:hypothetical protein
MTEQAQAAPAGGDSGASTAAQTAGSTVLTPEAGNDAGAAAQAATEAPPSGEQPTTESEGAGAGTQTEAEPGEWSLTAPEGMEDYQSEFSAFATTMSQWLKANPKATAQEALAEAAKMQAQKVADASRDAQTAFENQVSEWETLARKDKEFGGEKFGENVAIAVKGLEKVGTPELKALLQQTGFGSHPEVIRAFHRIGNLMSDAGIHGEATPGQADPAALRYPTSAKK